MKKIIAIGMTFGLCVFGTYARDHHDRGRNHHRDHHRREYCHSRHNNGVRTATDIVRLVGASLDILRGPETVVVTQPATVVVPQPVVQPVVVPPPAPVYYTVPVTPHYQYIRY